MTDTHQKNCSTLLVIKGLEIKLTKRYYNRLVRMTKIKQTNVNYHDKDMYLEFSYTGSRKIKQYV